MKSIKSFITESNRTNRISISVPATLEAKCYITTCDFDGEPWEDEMDFDDWSDQNDGAKLSFESKCELIVNIGKKDPMEMICEIGIDGYIAPTAMKYKNNADCSCYYDDDDLNKIYSIFGKDNVLNLIESAMENSNLYYEADKEFGNPPGEVSELFSSFYDCMKREL